MHRTCKVVLQKATLIPYCESHYWTFWCLSVYYRTINHGDSYDVLYPPLFPNFTSDPWILGCTVASVVRHMLNSFSVWRAVGGRRTLWEIISFDFSTLLFCSRALLSSLIVRRIVLYYRSIEYSPRRGEFVRTWKVVFEIKTHITILFNPSST